MMRRLVLMGLLALAVGFAQRGGGRNSGVDIPNPTFGPGSKLDRMSELLSLNKDQKKDLKQTFDNAQKEAAPLHEQINKARQAIAEAVAAGKGQDDVGKLVNAEAELEGQMASVELKAFAQIALGLNEDQRSKAAALYGMMRGLFSGKNWNTD